MTKPKILIINDDGIHAPGIKYLWEVLLDVADVTIVAPASEQSGVGAGITCYKPLHVKKVAWERGTPAWSVSGTPVDCVRMALSVLLDQAPDIVVSGINRGSNAGRTVLFSGTVGGVIEATLRQIPGVAFSCSDFTDPDYAQVQRLILPIVNHVLENPLPKGTFLNVNFPVADEIKGVKLAQQGKGFWMENPQEGKHPEGGSYYWHGGKWLAYDEEKDSDVHLLSQGYATAVPIHIAELTDRGFFDSKRDHFNKQFSQLPGSLSPLES